MSSSLGQHSDNLQVLQVTYFTGWYHDDKANKPSHMNYRFGQCFTAESMATQQTGFRMFQGLVWHLNQILVWNSGILLLGT